jgi:hypothetical protein
MSNKFVIFNNTPSSQTFGIYLTTAVYYLMRNLKISFGSTQDLLSCIYSNNTLKHTPKGL